MKITINVSIFYITYFQKNDKIMVCENKGILCMSAPPHSNPIFNYSGAEKR